MNAGVNVAELYVAVQDGKVLGARVEFGGVLVRFLPTFSNVKDGKRFARWLEECSGVERRVSIAQLGAVQGQRPIEAVRDLLNCGRYGGRCLLLTSWNRDNAPTWIELDVDQCDD